jgi:hypothetical protein
VVLKKDNLRLFNENQRESKSIDGLDSVLCIEQEDALSMAALDPNEALPHHQRTI